jgi:hypothetical protein
LVKDWEKDIEVMEELIMNIPVMLAKKKIVVK